jgi:hypothetical protein
MVISRRYYDLFRSCFSFLFLFGYTTLNLRRSAAINNFAGAGSVDLLVNTLDIQELFEARLSFPNILEISV